MRSFTLTVAVDPNLAFAERIAVPDDGDVRYHDVALVLRALLAKIERRGSDRVPTAAEVRAFEQRVEAANAVLADWEPTVDGVSIYNGVPSRTFRHVSGAEMVAVCDEQGRPTLETADTLATWKPEA